jgi:hypothetical protein
MKFQSFAVGARFEFEGKVYTKTGPLTAATEEGGQRMIPRSALLKPLDAPVEPPPRRGRKLDEASVLTAFEAFHGECARLLAEAAGNAADQDAARMRWLQTQLAAARARFLAGTGIQEGDI